MNANILTGVKEVVASLCGVGRAAEDIRDDEAIFDTGIGLDSMAAVVLLEGLEARFEIAFDSSDLTSRNFESIQAVADMISKKLAQFRAGQP